MVLQEVLSIIVITYGVCEAIKTTKLDNKYIPPIATFIGCMVAVTAKITGQLFTDINWVDAVATGIFNGLSAVGANQWIKQLKR